jgi:hypothetical protein
MQERTTAPNTGIVISLRAVRERASSADVYPDYTACRPLHPSIRDRAKMEVAWQVLRGEPYSTRPLISLTNALYRHQAKGQLQILKLRSSSERSQMRSKMFW